MTLRVVMFRLLVLMWAAVLVPHAARGGEPASADLTPRFRADETATYVMTEIISDELTMAGRGTVNASKLEQKITYSLRTLSASESGAIVRVTIDAIVYDLSSPALEKPEHFDSAVLTKAGEPPLIERILTPVIGSSMTLTLDPTGQITAVDAPALELPNDRRNILAKQYSNLDLVRARLGRIFTVHAPKSSVAPGATWTAPETLESYPGVYHTLKLTTNFRLQDFEAASGRATIAEASNATLVPASGQEPMLPTLTTFRRSGSGRWDVGASRLHSWSARMDVQVKSMRDPAMDVTSTVSTEITLERVR